MYKLSKEELRYRQSLPLDLKIPTYTIPAMRSFLNYYGQDGVYLSFSGGKDSTVGALLFKKYFPDVDVPLVYLDTWMEDPRNRTFVHAFADKFKFDLITIKPELSLKEIIRKDGFMFPSKEASSLIHALRNGAPRWARDKIEGLDKYGKPSPNRQHFRKFWFLIDADVPISNLCCLDMKEKPAIKFEKETGRHPIVFTMAAESQERRTSFLRTACTTFDQEVREDGTIRKTRPMCRPLGDWMTQNIYQYIYQNNIELSEAYGNLSVDGELPGQVFLPGTCNNCKYRMHGIDRTGCIMCAAGAHLNNFQKLQSVKKYNPKLFYYVYEELGMKRLVELVSKYMPYGV